jgi:hypothetical protein
MILGLGAGDAHHPSLGFIANLGFVRTMVGVLQSHLHTARECLVDAPVDHRAPDPKLALQARHRNAIGVANQYLGALSLAEHRRELVDDKTRFTNRLSLHLRIVSTCA